MIEDLAERGRYSHAQLGMPLAQMVG